MTDRIANPWGERTPFGPGGEWPVRVDQFLEGGISEDEVDRWVQTASLHHANGDAMDLAVKDGEPLIKWGTPEECFEAWKECTRGRPCDYTGLTYEKLRGGSGIQWPCNAEHPEGTERVYAAGNFNTQTDYSEGYGHDLLTGATLSEADHKALGPDGRAILHAAEYIPPHEEPGEEYPFRLATGRTIYHFHTRTKTARAPQLQNAAPDAWVEISPSDAEGLGIGEGDVVRVESPRGGMEARARISGIREGVVFAPFHYGYWDTPEEDGPDGHPRAANELTITEWDPVSKQPLFKVGAVKVTKVADAGGEPSPAPTTTASAPVAGEPGGPTPTATTGNGSAEATQTVKEG